MALERRKKKDERRKKKKVYIIYACIACMLSYKNGSENNRQQEGAETRKARMRKVQRTGILWEKKGEKGKSDTRTSNVVSHHRTNRARPCLTSEIGRDQVLSR